MNPSIVQSDLFTPSATFTDLSRCPVCGGSSFSQADVLWPDLITTWELTQQETTLINRQQGYHCDRCGSNLRSMTLAAAINEFFDWQDTLDTLASHPAAGPVRLLEINEAGSLHPTLSRFPQSQFGAYPDVDMQQLPYDDAAFDLVVHSDTLEHVPDPVAGLRECRRILRPGGCMIMTIPIVPSRFTRRRIGLPPSFHGNRQDTTDDLLVQTEYGSDFFLDFMTAGWRQLTLYTLTGPESLAIIGMQPISLQEGHRG